MASTTQEQPSPTRTAPRRRRRYVVAGGLCAAAVIYLLTQGLSRNVVYFRTVSEAVERGEAEPGRFRIAGAVLPGSLRTTAAGVVFRLTDGKATASVIHQGNPPELFKEGAPVVCEERWHGDDFACDRIMIKHGAEYRPPAVDTRTSPER